MKDQHIITLEREYNEQKDLPDGFTGVVEVDYKTTRTDNWEFAKDSWGRYDYSQRTQYTIVTHTIESYHYKDGELHREGCKPAVSSSSQYLEPVAWNKPRKTKVEYWLNGRKVTKKSCVAGADKESTRVHLWFDGFIRVGEDLRAHGVDGTLYALEIGEDSFVVNQAGRKNGQVTNHAENFLHENNKAVIKSEAELVAMFHEMFSQMSLVG